MTFRFSRLDWGRFAFAVALTVASLVNLGPGALAHGVKVGDLEIKHPWTRATAEGAKVAGGFLVIRNTGSTPDRLVGGTAGFADVVEIHEMAMEGEVMKMRQLADGIEIPPGGEIVLKPGSFHIMFMGLKHGLTEGVREPGTLVFEKAGTVEVEWAVETIGAKAAEHESHTQ